MNEALGRLRGRPATVQWDAPHRDTLEEIPEAEIIPFPAASWVNKDVLVHTATARNGDFDVNLPPKKSGSIVLKKAGTVDYYCRYHPNMKATLKIEP